MNSWSEPALPDPGGAEHEDRPDLTGRGGVGERVQHDLQFAIATDHRRREPDGAAHALHAGLASEDPVPLDDPRLPLELERDRRSEPEGAMRRGEGALAHEDRPRLRDLFEARRDVDGVAGDDALVDLVSGGRDHLAGVHADVDLQPHPVLPFEFGVQFLEPLEHLERGAHGALRVVLVRDRRAEHRQRRVADVLLDRAAPRIHRRGHRREVPLQDRAQPFGIQPLAELDGTGEIGEHDRGELALLAPGGRVVERRPAMPAVREVGGVVLPAARAGRHARILVVDTSALEPGARVFHPPPSAVTVWHPSPPTDRSRRSQRAGGSTM